jgi:glycosyltransferase involved in cell wall biosynthesis
VREVPWNSYFPVSTRMLAGEFARHDWNVIWLTPPLMPWKNEYNTSHYEQLIEQHKQGGIFYGNNVFAYTPRGYIPFSRHFPLDRPWLARLSWVGCWPSLRSTLRRANVPEPDFLWLGNLMAGGVQTLFPNQPAIFHVTDNYEHFPTVPATCVLLERKNYTTADQIIVTAPSLKHLLMTKFGVPENKVSVITQGVQIERFAGSHAEPPEDLSRCPHPRIVALGNTKWLDYGILPLLAEAFPQGSIVILGPTCPELENLAETYHNIFALGGISPGNVPNYLTTCDVGLVLFGQHIQKLAQDVCPMKLFEYAGAGLPVVCSPPLPIYRELDAPVLQAESPNAVIQSVNQALADRGRLGREMLAFAQQHTWQNKYDDAIRIVESLLAE